MKTFSMTDVGRRREMNQDYMFTSETAVGKLPNLFVVADGMGGHKAGEYASKFTVETMVEFIKNSESEEPVTAIRQALKEANRLLLKEAQADDSKAGMGTTVVAATLLDKTLYAANVGDSRLYVIGDEIKQVTKDHSLVEEMIRIGSIDRGAARNHPDKNIITRAIGANDTVDIDFFSVELKPREKVLMCSDGLTNMLEDEEIRRIVQGTGSIECRARELVSAANDRGGRDNISVILIEQTA